MGGDHLLARLKKVRPILLLLLAALALVLPQLFMHKMILGSDTLFHFNRFYDTAMQLKDGNFQYFISMYGFQQSARIVNPFYGPFFSYFQGVLVLLSGSWFRYQVLSNFVLFLIAAFSMYALLRKARVDQGISAAIAIFYLTTFAIQYWVIRQGFSAWGAALMPLCLFPILDLAERKTIHPLALGFFTALMAQTHMLTSLFLIMAYIPYFLYAFFSSPARLALVKKLFQAIAFFFLFTMNLWVSFFYLYRKNSILAPFINQDMADNTITGTSSHWVATPPVFFWVLIGGGVLLIYLLLAKKTVTPLTRITLGTSFAFLILSTSLVPWQYLLDQKLKLVELIQFPFRFLYPAILLFLLIFGLLSRALNHTEMLRGVRVIFQLAALVALTQCMMTSIDTLKRWDASQNYTKMGKHVFFSEVPAEEIKKSFFSPDLSKSLALVQKATPDYLPVDPTFKQNKYKAYQEWIIDEDQGFQKEVLDHQLVIQWQGDAEKRRALPVIVYSRTKLVLNGTPLKQPIKTAIGSLIVEQKDGKNNLKISYAMPRVVLVSLLISAAALTSGGAALIAARLNRCRKKRKE